MEEMKREKAGIAAKDLSKYELEKQLRLLDKHYDETEYLVNSDGILHPTAVKTHTFNRDTVEAQKLLNIFSTPVVNNEHMRCLPFYRDGVIFYDNSDNCVAVVNICLSCWWIQLDENTYLDVDSSIYQLLEQYFISLGHEIEQQ